MLNSIVVDEADAFNDDMDDDDDDVRGTDERTKEREVNANDCPVRMERESGVNSLIILQLKYSLW